MTVHARRPFGAAEVAAVIVATAVAAGLRLWRLDCGWFGVDQARDIATALDIAAGVDFPTIGPTMRRVTRLGALYYYYWTLPYIVWRDPMAGYWFAAFAAVATVPLVWWLARRLFGAGPALVALAVAMAHPISVIDTRIAWAPAALPPVATLLLCLMLAGGSPPSPARVAAIGGLLGLALQLHLSMLAWVVAAAVMAILDRLRPRALVTGAASLTVVALPALWALVAAPEEAEFDALSAERSGLAFGPRLGALLTLPVRVPRAFSQWPGDDFVSGLALRAAAIVLASATILGLLRLAVQALRAERRPLDAHGFSGEGDSHGARVDRRAARVLVVITGVQSAMVVGLPSQAWYYYLDALLPVWALAAAALVAPTLDGVHSPNAIAAATRDDARPTPARTSLRAFAGLGIAGAALTLAVGATMWVRAVAAAGFIAVDPADLSLDRRPARDAAVAGRLVTVGVKRDLAALTAAGAGDFAGLWRRLHGPAFADTTGDNGFWFRWSMRPDQREVVDLRHVAIWYREHPIASDLERRDLTATVTRQTIGPLLVVRYPSAIDYESCRGDGVPIEVPIRVVPHPRRYGVGSPPFPETLPTLVECVLRARHDATYVVAALGGPGVVEIAAGNGTAAPAGRASALCIPAANAPTFVRARITTAAGAPSDLDLYDVPLGAGCRP